MSCLIDRCLPTIADDELDMVYGNEEIRFMGTYFGRKIYRLPINASSLCTSLVFATSGVIFAGFGIAAQYLHTAPPLGIAGLYIGAGILFGATVVQLAKSCLATPKINTDPQLQVQETKPLLDE
ncbi:MAG: hypothetical protein JSR46_05995 [Verrucomicrobia bacterium]|nr:hypothetical protein [Verrucomicrobiota bacterium]